MKKNYLYAQPKMNFRFAKAFTLFVIVLITAFTTNAQQLVFQNPVLISGTAGQNNAVYRFPQVIANVDALVKINGRSSSQVRLVNIDLSSVGHGKSFQPQVTYGSNDRTPNGITDWWMEFEISFVQANTIAPVVVTTFDVTAIDIDGNGESLNEWVSLYNLTTFTYEANTMLTSENVYEDIAGVNTLVGKKFSGPTTNFADIDTSATRVMVSANYKDKNTFRLRTGGHSVGQNGAADRMYSLWFKKFTFLTPVNGSLPVKLSAFTAKKASGKVTLNWATEMEKNVSHFVIERSTNGADFSDIGMLFTDGNSESHREYSFTDDLKNVSGSLLYYRLRIVDMDAKFEKSAVRIIRLNSQTETASILTYPNPVVRELRVTLPNAWQGNKVVIDIVNMNGQIVKHLVSARASQTETLNVNDLGAGIYLVKATNGLTSTVQRIVKSN